MSGYVKLGARAIKMKIGGMRIREDVERVAAVRDAVGPDVDILLDANGAYTVFDAVKVARSLEPLDIYWFEEPIHPEDYEGLARVAGSTTIPIAAGENEYTKHGFRDLIERTGVGILNADAQILGGITEFMKVAAIAQAHNVPIAPHGHPHIHTPLVAAIPNGLIVEYYPSSVVRGRAPCCGGRSASTVTATSGRWTMLASGSTSTPKFGGKSISKHGSRPDQGPGPAGRWGVSMADRIERIEARIVSVPLPAPVAWSNVKVSEREYVLVWIRTADGGTGLGFTVGSRFRGGAAVIRSAIENALSPVIVGRDPTEIERLWEQMSFETLLLGARGAVTPWPVGGRHRLVGPACQAGGDASVATC